MARTKEFDVDDALRSALDLFWERGYEATSVADLVERLGIGKASLYATFGTKHDLYVKALDHYVRTTDDEVLAELAVPGPALDAVRGFVQRYVDDILADVDRKGCLVVNAAVELPGDPEVAQRVARSWDALETGLTITLGRARAQQEFDGDPRATARFLLAVLQGLRVLGKGSAAEGRVRDAAAQALAILERSV